MISTTKPKMSLERRRDLEFRRIRRAMVAQMFSSAGGTLASLVMNDYIAPGKEAAREMARLGIETRLRPRPALQDRDAGLTREQIVARSHIRRIAHDPKVRRKWVHEYREQGLIVVEFTPEWVPLLEMNIYGEAYLNLGVAKVDAGGWLAYADTWAKLLAKIANPKTLADEILDRIEMKWRGCGL